MITLFKFNESFSESNSETTEKHSYILNDPIRGINRYGLLIYGPHPTINHLTCYLNLPVADWRLIDDSIRLDMDITFESIESGRVSLPSRAEREIPIPLSDFWIGFDYLNRPWTWRLGEMQLCRLCEQVNLALELASV